MFFVHIHDRPKGPTYLSLFQATGKNDAYVPIYKTRSHLYFSSKGTLFFQLASAGI